MKDREEKKKKRISVSCGITSSNLIYVYLEREGRKEQIFEEIIVNLIFQMTINTHRPKNCNKPHFLQLKRYKFSNGKDPLNDVK